MTTQKHNFHNVVELSHPLALHFVTHLRDKTTKPALFRTLCKKLSLLLALEASKSFGTTSVEVDTPLEKTQCHVFSEEIVVVPILRAGLGMLEPITELFPNVAVGYVGIQRDEETALPSEYYSKLPPLEGRTVLLTDPMLASGGSAAHAAHLIKKCNPKKIVLLSIVAAPEGIQHVIEAHPDISIVTASIDRCLNARKYILPGLGDFGDRLYGTSH
jgi:uracil phosphoribosyltransferase